jgi:serine/threonine protein kinase
MKSDKSNSDIKSTVKELMEINHIRKIPLKDIALKKKIGEGGQAKVYNGTLDNELVAVKVLEEVDWKCLAHEIVIISNLQHECIPKFYGIVVDESVLALVFQFLEGKTLDEYKVMELSNDVKIKVAKSLASVLDYIHGNKFIHRDLKPENIILDKNGNCYLIDYGIAKVMTNTAYTITRAKGTLHYLAPECLDADDLTENEEIISMITPAVDVWAYGCILSFLFSGILPWCNKYTDNSAVIQNVLMKKKPFPVPESITNETIVKVITAATNIKWKERCTMADIRELLDKI